MFNTHISVLVPEDATIFGDFRIFAKSKMKLQSHEKHHI